MLFRSGDVMLEMLHGIVEASEDEQLAILVQIEATIDNFMYNSTTLTYDDAAPMYYALNKLLKDGVNACPQWFIKCVRDFTIAHNM